MRLLEDFNEITKNKYNYLRLMNITVLTTKAKVLLKLLVPREIYGNAFGDLEQKEVLTALKELLPSTLDISVEYIKSYVDVERATKTLYDYFVEHHPSIDSKFIKAQVDIVDGIINIKLTVNKLHYDFIMSTVDALKDYFGKNYCNECKIELLEELLDIDFDIPIVRSTTEYYIKRRIDISITEHISGKKIMIEPKYIVDKKDEEKDAVFAGKIVEYTRRESKKTGFPYYVISIDDTTGRLIAKAFTRSENSAVYDKLKVGDTIVVQGDLSYDSYSNAAVLMVRSMATCTINNESIILTKPYKTSDEYYRVIKPYDYVSNKQVDLFTMNVETVIPECYIGKDFVVFDLETTGLDLKSTEVIEIAAVKIRDGKIIECFSSFCKPSQPISEKITEITHITDAMVAKAPLFKDVFPDFYKFTRGAALVAHNSSYDMGYIMREAKDLNYYIDNTVFDTISLAKKSKRIYNNYSLASICATEKIVNEGAHRAIYDALATAELFLILYHLTV